MDALVPDNEDAPTDAGIDALDGALDPADGSNVSKCSSGGWCYTDLPAGASLTSVWTDGAGAVWALDRGKFILRWDGTEWLRAFEAPIQRAGGAIWGSGPTDLWAFVGGTMFHGTGTTSAALSWSVDPSSDAGVSLTNIVSIAGTGPSDVWAVGGPAPAALWRYAGPGSGWARDEVLRRVSSGPFSQVATVNGEIWVAGGAAARGVLIRGRMTGAGIQWVSLTLPRLPPRNGVASITPSIKGFYLDDGGGVWLAGEDAYKGDPSFKSFIVHGVIDGDTIGSYDQFFLPGLSPSTKSPSLINAVWGSGRTVFTAGQESGAVGSIKDVDGGIAFVAERISLSSVVPQTGPFVAIHGSRLEDIWVVGGALALHKTEGQVP